MCVLWNMGGLFVELVQDKREKRNKHIINGLYKRNYMTLESMNKKFLFKEWIWELILTHTRNMILVHLDEANNLEYIKHGGTKKKKKKIGQKQ